MECSSTSSSGRRPISTSGLSWRSRRSTSWTDAPASVDPSLFTVLARVKKAADAVYVRDQILARLRRARAPVDAKRLADAKSHERYGFGRSLDSTERIARPRALRAFRRSFDTVNNYYRPLATLTPADLQAAARSTSRTRALS